MKAKAGSRTGDSLAAGGRVKAKGIAPTRPFPRSSSPQYHLVSFPMVVLLGFSCCCCLVSASDPVWSVDAISVAVAVDWVFGCLGATAVDWVYRRLTYCSS